jgi:glycerophosphoryl diester phosphodiesterase
VKVSFWDNFKENKNIIIAHRGERSVRAENTLCAFEKSLGRCDMVEFDVGFSKDGIPIIIHDDTLNRTTNIEEIKSSTEPFKVIDFTYMELLKLDFSSWFIKKDPFNGIKDDLVSIEELEALDIQRVLKLEELLEFLKDNNMFANVEIKDLEDTPFDDIASKKVLDIIYKLDMQNRVIISSFNHKYLKEIKTMDKDIEIGVLQEKSHPENLIEYLKSMDAKAYHPCIEIVDEKLVKDLQKEGIFVNVFTVNKKSDIDKLFSWGVKGVFTDFL